MSTLKTDTLSNTAGTKSVPVNTVVDGSAKAWVNFNGTGTVAIRASFNVSSITDNGVGNYTVNFTAAMPDANYSVAVNAGDGGTGGAGAGAIYTQTTTSQRLYIFNTAGSAADYAVVSLAVFR